MLPRCDKKARASGICLGLDSITFFFNSQCITVWYTTAMRIVYFYKEDSEAGYAKEHLSGHELVLLKGCLSDYPDFHDDQAEVLCVFVDSLVHKEDFSRFPKLKHIATRSTGFDHIDVGEARARNISISYVPAYGENTVAEFAMGLLLMVSRKLYESVKKVQEEGLFSQAGLRGFDLKGKTIGILGTGRIGLHMIRMAKGFEMDVVAFDAFPKPELATQYGFTYASFDDVLAQSDVVSVHLPYMSATHHIINVGNIGKMKKGAVLINSARGGLVETDALVKGLKEGILGAVGLDVLEEEGYIEDETRLIFDAHPNEDALKTTLANHYLIEHPRAIITPHNAFNTGEAIMRILETATGNIKAYASGQPENLIPESK